MIQRTKRILSHGWMPVRSRTIMTFGYYPFYDIIGKLCIGAISLTKPGLTIAMRKPTFTTVIEDCD